jgi:hypothetical protein
VEFCVLGVVIPFKLRRRAAEPPPASAATRPNKPKARPLDASLVYRAVGGWPIHWRDSFGMVHTCEATEIHPGCMLTWTLCSKDIYDDAAYVSCDLDEVTCPVCAKERWTPRDPNGPGPAWVPGYKPGNDNG